MCRDTCSSLLLGGDMPRTVALAVELPATAARLYRMYLDPKEHAAFTGAPVKIAARAGSPFVAFRGALSGRILQLIPNRLIVQSWRSTQFAKADLDSTLVLSFWPVGSETRIELTHVNVADSDFAGVSEGWSKYYWIPWRAYLLRK
jgi:activator of HSP90 ATPase